MAVTEEVERDYAEVLADPRIEIDALVELRKEAHTSMKLRRRFELVLDDFKEKVAAHHPSESSSDTRRGVLQWILGNLDPAVRALEECRASKEKFYFLGRSLLEQEKFHRAAEVLEEAYGTDRADLTVALAFAEARIRALDLDKSEVLVDRLLKKHPGNPDVIYLRGLLKDMKGDPHGAQVDYEKAHDLDPGHQKVLFRLAYMLDLQGEESRAQELYTQLRRMKPMHINTMINLGLIYEDRGDYEKAAECFRSIHEFHPNHSRARLYLSDAEASLDMYYDEDAAKKEARLRQTLGQSLVDFSFSRRVREAFSKLGITTVGDLATKTEEEMLEVPNFGRTSLDEIREFLSGKNLSMAYQDAGGVASGPTKQDAAFTTAIDELDLPSRVVKTLEAHEIATVGDLVKKSEKDLKDLNFSASAMEEIRERLSLMGLHLRPS